MTRGEVEQLQKETELCLKTGSGFPDTIYHQLKLVQRLCNYALDRPRNELEKEVDRLEAILAESDEAEQGSLELFVELRAKYDALLDHMVELWHGNDTCMALHEWLGMTKEEYAAWVERTGAWSRSWK